MSPNCDLDFEDSKPVFSHDTPAYYGAPQDRHHQHHHHHHHHIILLLLQLQLLLLLLFYLIMYFRYVELIYDLQKAKSLRCKYV